MDTFESGTKNYEKMTEYMGYENVRRIAEQQKRRINVIIGQPALFGVDKTATVKENPNLSYPHVDARIKESLMLKRHKATLINSLYDSYIRAFQVGKRPHSGVRHRGVCH